MRGARRSVERADILIGPHVDDYDARHLLVLEGLEAVRKRPGMYIGSTDTRGLMHCLWEIIDNSVDEALGGLGRRSRSSCTPTASIEVRDNGRGIPVDIEPKTGLSGVEVVFTKLHAGGKFGGGSYNATGGLHGVGASVVNALSTRLDVEVDRGGTTYGDVVPPRRAGRLRRRRADRTFTPGGSLRKVGRTRKGVTGTRVRYWPDRQIFLKDAQLSLKDLARPRPADQLPGAGPRAGHVDGRADRRGHHRGGSSTTAGSRSSASSWRPTSRSPTSSGCRVRTASPRPCRCSTTPAT